jgi:hypothetical protein
MYYGEENALDFISESRDKLKEQAILLNEQPIVWEDYPSKSIGYIGGLDIYGESDRFYVIESVTVI